MSDTLGRREDLARVEAIGVVTALARRLMDGDLPAAVSERAALERKLEAFDMIPRHDSGRAARDARVQAGEALEQFVAWHREDLDRRLIAAPLGDSATEGYRFYLNQRPVVQIDFTAEGSHEDTGWFLWSIDTTAFEASPDDPSRWLGDAWPADVTGVDVDELVAAATTQDRSSLRAQATAVAQRTRSDALHAARARLLGDLASDLAKGASPFQPSEDTSGGTIGS